MLVFPVGIENKPPVVWLVDGADIPNKPPFLALLFGGAYKIGVVPNKPPPCVVGWLYPNKPPEAAGAYPKRPPDAAGAGV